MGTTSIVLGAPASNRPDRLLRLEDDRVHFQHSESWAQRLRRLTGIDPTVCPVCKTGRLVHLETLKRRPKAVSRAPP